MSRNRQEYQPLRDPIDPGDGSLDWYYGDHAGGMTFDFGKHSGKKLHAVCLNYIAWSYTTRTASGRSHPTLSAIELYVDGLREYAKENYLDFVVPFGQKHGGQTIGECRDKKWMVWSCTIQDLINKYPVYFLAVDYHLENPRHYNQTRDIGELLSATKYADDKDLQHEEEQDESDLSDIVVPDGHVEYESDTESDSDSDEGCREGMKAASPKGKKPKKAKSSTATSKGKNTPKSPSKKARKNITDSLNDFIVNDGASDGDASYESSATETNSRRRKSAQAGSPKKPSKTTPKKPKDSLDGFLVDDSSHNGDASFQPSCTETESRENLPSESLGAEIDSEAASTINSRQVTPESDSNQSTSKGYSTPSSKVKRTTQSRKVQRQSNNRDIFSGDVQVPGSSHFKPRRTKMVVESEDEPPPTARSRGRRGSCPITLPRHLTLTPFTRQRPVTPSSKFDSIEAEAGSEGDDQETDSGAASTVSSGSTLPASATSELDSNKSASEEDSVYATPTPKGRQTKQSRSVQRYSKSRDVFDGDVRIPESSPSKPGRAKVVVDSEDEPPPTARPRKRQVTPSSDSDVVEAASEGLNESDEDDFGENVQSPGPCVPVTPHRRVSRRVLRVIVKNHSYSQNQTHSASIRPRSTNRRKREGPPSKHGLHNLKPLQLFDDDVEAPRPIPVQESLSSSRVLASQQKKRSQVASWIRQRNTLEPEEVGGRRLNKETYARATLKRKKRSFEIDNSNDDGGLTSYARRPEQTVVQSRPHKKKSLKEPLQKKARISTDEESLPPPSPPPVKKTKEKHNRVK